MISAVARLPRACTFLQSAAAYHPVYPLSVNRRLDQAAAVQPLYARSRRPSITLYSYEHPSILNQRLDQAAAVQPPYTRSRWPPVMLYSCYNPPSIPNQRLRPAVVVHPLYTRSKRPKIGSLRRYQHLTQTGGRVR